MSEVKPYKLPEEKTSIVSDSMAVRITPDTDIVTLRHNVMDAVLAADTSLQNWVAFPDARGYIYLDYTQDNNIAGVTIANHQVVAFIKRDGHLSKFSFDKLDENSKNVPTIRTILVHHVT